MAKMLRVLLNNHTNSLNAGASGSNDEAVVLGLHVQLLGEEHCSGLFTIKPETTSKPVLGETLKLELKGALMLGVRTCRKFSRKLLEDFLLRHNTEV
jgi:hypothetical protein